MKEIKTKVEKICIDAKKATESLANLDTSIKNKILNEAIKLLKKKENLRYSSKFMSFEPSSLILYFVIKIQGGV